MQIWISALLEVNLFFFHPRRHTRMPKCSILVGETISSIFLNLSADWIHRMLYDEKLLSNKLCGTCDGCMLLVLLFLLLF